MMYTILISQPEKNFHVNLSSEYYWGSVSRRVEVVEAVLVVVASDDKSINWCFCCFSVRKVNSWFTITWRSADPASLLLLASTWKVLKSSRITKGQLISKCPFGFIVWTKIPIPGDLVCNIINKEACRKPQKASRKPPRSYKKFQGRNPEIISLVILSKQWNQRDILKLTDLYSSIKKKSKFK